MLLMMLAVVRRKSARFALGVTALALTILYVFSIEPVSNRMARSLEMPPLRTVRNDTTYDAAVLLGGMVDPRATDASGLAAYNENIERMLAAYDLVRTGRARNVIVSGGLYDA